MSLARPPHRGDGGFLFIAPPRTRFLITAAFFLIVGAFYVALAASYDPYPLWGRIAVCVPFGAAIGWFVALAGARTALRGDSVQVVSVTRTRLVPAREVVRVDVEKGTALTLVSGRRISVVRRGIPLIAMVTSEPRGRRAARRLNELLASLDGARGAQPEDTTVTVPRWTMLVLTIALIALMVWLSGLGPTGSGG